jgi:aminoglycoside phosphotransferase (APT) family kinase protein
MSMTHASSLFQELEPEALQNIVHTHLGSTSFTASLLKGGLFNTTYRIELAGGEKQYVLRVGPVNRHLLLPFETQLMASEEWVYRLCEEQNIRVPHVVVCCRDRRLIDRDYMITEYIDSVCLNDGRITPDEKRRLYRETGRMTAALHAIRRERFGRAGDVLNGRGFACWGAYLQSEFAQATEALKQRGIFEEADLAQIRQLPERYAELLDRIQTASLVHADLWEGNVLVSPDHKRVVAVIDADRALFGDAAYEFAGGWMQNADFMEGYGATEKKNTDAIVRNQIYALLYRLIDTYVYYVEYNDAVSGARTKEKVLNFKKALLNV